MVETATILDALEAAGYRLTNPRRALAALIATRPSHFTAEELLGEARHQRLGVTRATTFRSLDILMELGLVERLDMPSGEHAFVACDAIRHHHHIVCSSCGRSTEVQDSGLEALTARIVRETGYRMDGHRLELYGLCPTCQREPHP